jgi:iron complex outermembrane receptor protein
MKRGNKIALALLAGASMTALTAQAHAQAAQAQAVEEVVVTGSRIVQNGNNSPTPVTVVSTQALITATPSTLADALIKLPVFAGYSAQQANPGNSSQNSGSNGLNLRSIGAARTLTLFNGQRLPVNNIDNIPQMLIQRVDIVTGGASAVYGSDAVAGVVNFILDKKFNGLKVNGQYGVSRYSDDSTLRVGVAGGKSFLDGRLHLEGSAEYYNNPGIKSKLARQIGRDVWTTQGAGRADNPYHLVKNTRLSNTSFFGKIVNGGPLSDMVFRENGVLSPFVHGTPAGVSNVESGGDGAYFDQATMVTMLRNEQYFGRADYALTDNVNVWAQASNVKGHNRNNHQNNEFTRNYTVSATNAFLAPQYQNILAGAGVKTFTYGKMMDDAPVLQPETFISQYMYATGADGKFSLFGKDWRWEIGGTTSASKQATNNNANLRNDKFAAALDSVVNPANGQIVCSVTLTNPTAFPGCVPVNVFGPTSQTAAMNNYFLEKTSFITKSKLQEISGAFTGSPFDTWAGPVNVAISGEYRHQSQYTDSNAQPSDLANCTGIRFNCTQGTTVRWISNVVASSPKASLSVKEAAIEADIPLVKDVPFIQSFNINAAGRWTDYSTSGTVYTWKLGGEWHVNDEVNFRATRSRDILAPSLTQLYGATSVNPSGISDLHTGVSSQAPVASTSNANLVPEVANTVTGGVVYRPTWLPSFSVSVDAYRIKIANGIGNVSGNNSTIAKICEDSNGTSTLCALYIRPLPFSDHTAANFPTLILSQNLNIANFYSRGIDTEINYGFDVGPGRINVRGLMTYQPKQITVTIPGTAALNSAGAAGLPSKRINLRAQYVQGPFAFDVQERWHSHTRRSNDPSQVYLASDGMVPEFYTTDMNVAYDLNVLGGTNQIFLNVQNVFDKKPPPASATGGTSSVPGLFLGTTNGDDFIGRYFTFGFRAKY